MTTVITTEEQIKVPTVCIVSFKGQAARSHLGERVIYYQVTINPEKVSPDGLFIRLGDTQGDEILGWIPTQDIAINAVLGDLAKNPADTVLNYGAPRLLIFDKHSLSE